MNRNPRTILATLVTSAALIAGLSACATGSGSTTPTKPRTASYPDCDLGDLREGDKDCKDPRAYADAVRKYGKTKVEAAAREYANKVAPKAVKPSAPKASSPKVKSSTKPGVPGLRKPAASASTRK